MLAATSSSSQMLMSSCWSHLRWLYWLLTFCRVDRWLFQWLTFLQSRFSLPSFSHCFHFCSLFLHIFPLNGKKKFLKKFFLAPSMLFWRGIRIIYLSLKLCVVFLKVACSSNIVLVQSLFLWKGQVKKILPSSLAWLNGIVKTTRFSLGFKTLPALPSLICWAVLMMQNLHGICWPRDTPLLTDPWNIS